MQGVVSSSGCLQIPLALLHNQGFLLVIHDREAKQGAEAGDASGKQTVLSAWRQLVLRGRALVLNEKSRGGLYFTILIWGGLLSNWEEIVQIGNLTGFFALALGELLVH